MKRYQIYLNPQSVDILDEFAQHIDVSRSRLIQKIVDQIAQNLTRVFVATKTPPKNHFILDSLVGSIKLKDKKETNFAQNIDEIYLRD